MEPEVSTKDILQAIHALDEKLTGKISGLEGRIDGIESNLTGKIGALDTKVMGRIDEVHAELVELIQDLSSSTDERFNAVDHQISGIRNEMVTKDYLDRKLADQDMETMSRVEKSFVRRYV